QRVQVEGVAGSELIHLDRVIDDQVGGEQRVGARRVGAHGGKSIAHGGQVDHARHARGILQQDAGRHEADLPGLLVAYTPRYIVDIIGFDLQAVFAAQQVFQQNASGERQPRDVANPFFFEHGKAKNLIIDIVHTQGGARTK